MAAAAHILDRVADTPGAMHARLAGLRAWMAAERVDWLAVPHDDAYFSEYLPDHAQRLAWLTGFTGSAGRAWIGREEAALFVDSRYTLQASEQADPVGYAVVEIPSTDPIAWLAARMTGGTRVAIDPWLHPDAFVARLRDSARAAGATIVALDDNPIDAIWTDQPPAPLSRLYVHDIRHTGEAAADKCARIAAALRRGRLDAFVFAAPLSVAWLLNLRGDDTPCTPTPLCRAILTRDGAVTLFTAAERPGRDALPAALGEGVAVLDDEALPAALVALAGKHVGIDPDLTPATIVDLLADATVVPGRDPCILPRAIKNATEIAGARAAHVRDGAALVTLLAWLAQAAPVTDECTVAAEVERLRAARGMHKPSFDTIAAAGPNAAIGHYRPTPASNRVLEAGTLFLLDSGGQYDDGTTDVTRTVAIGAPDPVMRGHFTRVLKGHIAIARLRFPAGVSGHRLDAVARLALWEAGLDYAHNTGHGVGAFLNVHEGPQGITRTPNDQPLLPGMILSNEPGYYRAGAFGMRIESLMVVTEPEPIDGGDQAMLSFETLTLAPIDRTLIDVALLTPVERDWVDAYHARIAVELTPLLDAAAADWLQRIAMPLTLEASRTRSRAARHQA